MLIQRIVLNDTPNKRIPVFTQSLFQDLLSRPKTKQKASLGSHVLQTLEMHRHKKTVSALDSANTPPAHPFLLIYNVKQQSRAGFRATLRGGPSGLRRGPGLYATPRPLSNPL